MAGVQWGVFALVGLFEFHSISLCGRLDPLPRRTTFGFRNALHLLEARDSVTYVRGIFQRFLALLWESELGCGYRAAVKVAVTLNTRSAGLRQQTPKPAAMYVITPTASGMHGVIGSDLLS